MWIMKNCALPCCLLASSPLSSEWFTGVCLQSLSVQFLRILRLTTKCDPSSAEDGLSLSVIIIIIIISSRARDRQRAFTSLGERRSHTTFATLSFLYSYFLFYAQRWRRLPSCTSPKLGERSEQLSQGRLTDWRVLQNQRHIHSSRKTEEVSGNSHSLLRRAKREREGRERRHVCQIVRATEAQSSSAAPFLLPFSIWWSRTEESRMRVAPAAAAKSFWEEHNKPAPACALFSAGGHLTRFHFIWLTISYYSLDRQQQLTQFGLFSFGHLFHFSYPSSQAVQQQHDEPYLPVIYTFSTLEIALQTTKGRCVEDQYCLRR